MMIILIGVVPGILRGGQNVYGRSVSTGELIDSIAIMLENKTTVLILVISLICTVIQFVQNKNISSITVAATPSVFLLVDQVFYQAVILDHYLTNKVVATVWLCAVVIKMLNDGHVSSAYVTLIVPAVLLIATFYTFQSGYDRVQLHKGATISFANGLDEVVKSKTDYSQVAFVVQSGWDYESIFSTIKQLRGRGDVRPYFLLISKKYGLSDDPNLSVFKDWSTNGLTADLYSPISNLNLKQEIICYYSESAQILDELCANNVVIRWLP
jgi:hypothetical protein